MIHREDAAGAQEVTDVGQKESAAAAVGPGFYDDRGLDLMQDFVPIQ